MILEAEGSQAAVAIVEGRVSRLTTRKGGIQEMFQCGTKNSRPPHLQVGHHSLPKKIALGIMNTIHYSPSSILIFILCQGNDIFTVTRWIKCNGTWL